jgi:hypothetical protein
MHHHKKILLGVTSLVLTALSPTAFAGTLVLEGSDATGVHGDQTGGSTYTTQLFRFMQGSSALPVAVLGTASNTPSAPAGSVFLSNLSGLSIANYSGLYIQSPNGCCDQNLSGAAVYGAQIGAFFAAGGSVAIMNYQGGNWSFIDPILVAPPSGSVRGYNTGGGGPTCTDNEVFNADGLAKGFTQPPALGCWQHQAYDMNHFGTLGFISLVDADPAYFGLTTAGAARGSAFIARGGALGTVGCTDPRGCEVTVPVPATLPLLAMGFLSLFTLRRRTVARPV